MRRAGAWVTASAGHHHAAASAAIEAAEDAEADGLLAWAVLAYHDAARLNATALAAQRLHALAAGSDSELTQAIAAHVDALDRGDPDRLGLAAVRFEDMGCLLFAAEAWAAASELHAASGRRVSSTRAHEHRARLEAAAGGPVSPGMRDQATKSLTAREREVAWQAAAGATSSEIAATSGVSIRTVDNQLHRCYSKLGIDGRGQLAAVLGLERE